MVILLVSTLTIICDQPHLMTVTGSKKEYNTSTVSSLTLHYSNGRIHTNDIFNAAQRRIDSKQRTVNTGETRAFSAQYGLGQYV